MNTNLSIQKRLVSSIREYVRNLDLMHQEGRYLVALSGGSDSVCMLLVLKELGFSIEAIHCNFHLRGEESDCDEQFCVDLCNRMNVNLHRIHFDTKEYAQAHGISIEMAARDLRYSFFCQLNNDLHTDGVCVAHHKDDVVETLMINLIRGTGIHGLTGIDAKREITVNNLSCNIIRPMLTVSKNDILDFLSAQQQPYVTDSTNLENSYVRNRIRLDILPIMRTINPSVDESIFKTANRLREAAKVFDEAVGKAIQQCIENTDESGKSVRISVDQLLRQTSPEYTMYSILSRYAFSSEQIETIAQMLSASSDNTGRCFVSPSHELLIDRNALLVEPISNIQKSMRIPEPGTYIFGGKPEKKFRIELIESENGKEISKQLNIATIDAADVAFPLTIRTVQEGDRFHPFGMKTATENGRPPKLVSDFLTDKKMSVFDKRKQLVVADAKGRIIWLVGERTDHRFRVTESTRKMLRLTVS